MTNTSDIPFTSAMLPELDEWSRVIYARIAEWPIAQQGRWTLWDPGFLVLEIDHIDGRAITPIRLDTEGRELCLSLASLWHARLPLAGHNEYRSRIDIEIDAAVADAHRMTTAWLAHQLSIAIFTNSAGEWCGSVVLDDGDVALSVPKEAYKLGSFEPVQAAVHTADPAACRVFSIRGYLVKETDATAAEPRFRRSKRLCPCCNPLSGWNSQATYDICSFCGWQDDGQDARTADEVWGGPNEDLSLTQAQENFEIFGGISQRWLKIRRSSGRGWRRVLPITSEWI